MANESDNLPQSIFEHSEPASTGTPAKPNIQDIFADSETPAPTSSAPVTSAATPAAPVIATPPSALPTVTSSLTGGTGPSRTRLIAIVSAMVVLVLIVAGATVAWILSKSKSSTATVANTVSTTPSSTTTTTTTTNQPVTPSNPVTQPVTPSTTSTTTTTTTAVEVPAPTVSFNPPAGYPADPKNLTPDQTSKLKSMDSDGDGLLDYDEIYVYHTNPLDPDTDHDGLSDRAEVMVYHTNPRDADTDKDGYLDGDEVKKGYNPNGPGRLYDLTNSTVVTPTSNSNNNPK